jgi:hypothetical protein
MAFGTAPVFAGMVGVDLGAAFITAPEVSAERFSTAGHDVGDGAPMRSRHRSPFCNIMNSQVVVRKAAEDVRDLEHDRRLPSQVAHHLVENALERGPGRLGQVHVDGGRRYVGVAEQDLHHASIDAVFQKSRRITMPQCMWADRSCDACGAKTETECTP